MLELLKKYRKYAFGAYFLLCVFYCAVKIALPVETTVGEGLQDLGRRQIVERTSYLNEGDIISFVLPVESKTLTSIGFYLNTDELILDGKLNIKAMDDKTGEVLAKSSILLKEIEMDQFVQLPVDHYTNGTVRVELSVEECEQGPRFWLNSTTETDAKSWYNGRELSYPLVYNAGFSVMTRDIKGAVVTTLMAVLFGTVLLMVTGEPKKEKYHERPEILEKLQEIYGRYKLYLGAVLTVGIVALLFFYVYDTQIRIVMNTTERRQIISSSEPEILEFSDTEEDIVQIVKCEEDTLTGLGVQLYVPEEAVGKGTLSGKVTDLTTGEVLSENMLDMTGAIDGEYINFLFTHMVESDAPHTFEIRPVSYTHLTLPTIA